MESHAAVYLGKIRKALVRLQDIADWGEKQ